MKKLTFIKTAFMSLTAAALLSSCLKDSRYVNIPSSVATVELPAATGVGPAGGAFEAQAFSIASTPTPLNVLVNYAGTGGAPTALNVKLSVDQASLTAYNTANNTNYTLLPAADYSSTLTATIPAGGQSANVVINVNTSLIDPSQSYVLPLTITDGGGPQISNWKTVLLNIQVKNKYDGVYTVTGSIPVAANPAYSGYYPIQASLITQSGNSAAYFDNVISNYYHEFLNGGSASYFGEFDPVLVFDLSTNKITSTTNLYGQPSPTRGRTCILDPTGVNAFTSGTPGTAGSVFKVRYSLYTGATLTATFDETWTYKGSR